MNMAKSRDIRGKMPSPKVIWNAYSRRQILLLEDLPFAILFSVVVDETSFQNNLAFIICQFSECYLEFF